MGWDPPLPKPSTVLPQSLQLYWYERSDLAAQARAARSLCTTPEEIELNRIFWLQKAAELTRKRLDEPEDQPIPKRRAIEVTQSDSD